MVEPIEKRTLNKFISIYNKHLLSLDGKSYSYKNDIKPYPIYRRLFKRLFLLNGYIDVLNNMKMNYTDHDIRCALYYLKYGNLTFSEFQNLIC